MDEVFETYESGDASGGLDTETLQNIEMVLNDIYRVQNTFYNDIITIFLFVGGILIGGFALKTFWEASSKW